MEIKKTVKYDGKLKGIRIVDKNVVDENGEVIDLIAMLAKAYEDKSFDLSTTTKEEEIIELDEIEEVDIEDLQ